MNLTLDGHGPLYEQIARALKALIVKGALTAHGRLPSTRALAGALHVSRKSVIEAYELLAAEQLIGVRPGVGTVVAALDVPRRARSAQRVQAPTRYAARLRKLPRITLGGTHSGPRYNFQYGAPLVNPRVFSSWTRKLAAAARRARPDYAAAEGQLALRMAIADYLRRRRGLDCSAGDILVVTGTQQAVSLTARVLLDEGDTAVLEDPFYELAEHALIAHGANVLYNRTDEEGLVVRELPASGARLVLISPSHQFPSGVVMSLARRLELLRWATQVGGWILEDDYDSEFHGGERPVAALRSLDLQDRVIYVSTFSKTLFPSLRLGYLVAPKGLREDFVRAKLLDDLGTPALEQVALAAFMQSGLYERQLRRSVREVLIRRRALLDAIRRTMGSQVEIGPCAGGMHLLLWLPGLNEERTAALVERARAAGVGVQSVAPYYHTPPRCAGLLIGYAGLSAGQIRTAIEILAGCLRRL